MFHKTLEEACAGDQMGILTKGVKKEDVRRGMAVCKIGTIKQHDMFDAQIYILNKEEGGLAQPLVQEKMLTVFSKTWDSSGVVFIDGKDLLMPSEDAKICMKLLKPMVVEKGQQFTVRLGNKTIGTGKVTDVKPNMSSEEREYLTLSKKKKDKLSEGK
jgi:elongation factor Tu